jgi:acetylornithine deacetylase/succinyl-diaminopimelate desuccinylase-like protein
VSSLELELLWRESLREFSAAHRNDFQTWLSTLVNIPSASVDPAHRGDVRRCAETARDLLSSVGAVSADIVETGGHPLVHARLTNDPDRPTITMYNHLDVQPAEGDDWRTPPFQLTIDGDRYIGRGATDDKGPALTALLAAIAARETNIQVNIAFLWELEEEIGSEHFASTLEQHASDFRTDAVVVSDTVWVTRGKPSSPAGLRGMQPFRLTLRTATADLHSGITGGVVRNPLAELMQVVSACFDARTGRVLIPGFYDEIEPLSLEDEDAFMSSGFSVDTFKRDHHVSSLRETDTLEVMRRLWALPTFEVRCGGRLYRTWCQSRDSSSRGSEAVVSAGTEYVMRENARSHPQLYR